MREMPSGRKEYANERQHAKTEEIEIVTNLTGSQKPKIRLKTRVVQRPLRTRKRLALRRAKLGPLPSGSHKQEPRLPPSLHNRVAGEHLVGFR